MGATSAGSIQLDLEVTANLEKDIQKQAVKIGESLQKQLTGFDTDVFKGLADSIGGAFKSMAETSKTYMDKMKSDMLAYSEQMKTIIAQISDMQMPHGESIKQNMPSYSKVKNSAIRGPPSNAIKIPKFKLDDQFNTDMMKQNITELTGEIDRLDAHISNLQEQRSNLLGTYKRGMNATAETKLNSEVLKLDRQIGALQDRIERATISLKAFKRQTDIKSPTMQMPKFPQLSNPLSMSKNSFNTSEVTGLSKVLSKLKGKATSVSSALGSMKTKIAVAGLSILSNIAGKTVSSFKLLGKFTANLGAKVLGLGKSSKKASNGMGRASMSAGRMVKSFLVFSMIFPLVSRGIMALGKNIGQTMMTNKQFADNLNQVRSNLATAFTPIIQAIMPALNALMSALAKITAYFAAFTSALFGKTYAASQQATQGIYDAKDAMGAYGNSASEAAKKTEKAQRTLMGFDEVNKLDDKKDNDKESNNNAPVYTPTQIDTSGVNAFVKKLKDMFKKGDWAGIGKMIGQQINKGVSTFTKWISWSNVGSEVTNFMNAFTGIFNSAVSTIDWNGIGNMFGTGINTIANTLYLLLTGINWQNLGSALANGLNGLVYKVDWEKLGRTIGSYFQAKIDAIYGFVTTADWPAIGKALADGIMGIINSVDWAKFAKTLAKGISGAISSLHNFIKNIDWTGVGSKIASSINSFFANMNWADMGATFSDAVLGLLDTLITAVKNINWVSLGESFAEVLMNIDWWSIITGLGDLLVRLIIGLAGAIGSAVKKLAKAMWDGLCAGIKEFFADPGAFIKRYIVDPFVSWFKSLFGIHSPSTVMKELGGYVMQGLINGIKSIPIVGSIAGAVGDGINWIKGKYNDFKAKGKELFENVKSGIANNPITKTVGSVVNKGVNAVANTYNSIKAKGKELIDNLKGGINVKKDSVISTIGNVASSMATKIKNVTQNAGTWGSDMMSGLASGISGAAGWVSNAVSSVADTIASWLHFSRPDVGPLHYYEEWMPDMMQGLSSTLISSTPAFISKVKALAGSMANAMQTGLDTPTIAFAGETALSVSHEWKESNKPDEITMKDIVEEIKSLRQKFDEVKEEIRSKDNDVYLDGKSIKDNTVNEINKDTRRNGKCPIDM